MAMAAMIPMTDTTLSSSIRLKPRIGPGRRAFCFTAWLLLESIDNPEHTELRIVLRPARAVVKRNVQVLRASICTFRSWVSGFAVLQIQTTGLLLRSLPGGLTSVMHTSVWYP